MADTPQSGNLTTRRQQAAARRQQIVDAAARLFAQQGVAKTTTRQIAREVGVAEGLIFRYFPSKLDLVRAVTDSAHVFLGDLRAILEDATAQPLGEVMERIATVWLDLLRREADLSSILFGEALINPDIGGLLDDVITQGAASLERFLNARKQAGEIAPLADTATIAHMYMASTLMFFLRYRQLPTEAWKQESTLFARQLPAAWLRMAAP